MPADVTPPVSGTTITTAWGASVAADLAELWAAVESGTGGGGGGPVTVADLPAGSSVDVFQAAGGTWAARPTARTDIRVNWVGYPGLITLPSGALTGRDSYVKRTT